VKRTEPVIPENTPGLPPIHDDFKQCAKHLMLTPIELVRRCLYTPGTNVTLPTNKARAMVTLPIICGTALGDQGDVPSKGPVESPIMIVGKCITKSDMQYSRPYSSDTGHILRHAMQRAGFTADEINSVYVTTLLKTVPLDSNKQTLQSMWIAQQVHLLYQEILLVKPKMLIVQGAEAMKALLGKSANMSKYESTVTELKIGDFKTKVVVTISPNAVLYARGRMGMTREKAYSNEFTSEEQRLWRQLTYINHVYKPENAVEAPAPEVTEDQGQVGEVCFAQGLKYYVVSNSHQLVHHLQLMRKCADNRVVAWDAEWQGRHPQDDDAYLRCVQFSYETTSAVVIALTHPGGKPRFQYKGPDKEWTTHNGSRVAAKLCAKYMEGMRAAGHFFNADLEWMVYYGMDLRPNYAPAASPELARTSGGLAIELAAHAIDETALFGLDVQLMTHTNVPNYNSAFIKHKASERTAILQKKTKVARWLQTFDKACDRIERGLKLTPVQYEALENFDRDSLEHHVKSAEEDVKQLDNGYGWISDEALYPYAAWDAAAELILANKFFFEGGLDHDRFGYPSWKAYWISHRAAAAVLEINCTGLMVDRDRVDELSGEYAKAARKLLSEIREYFNWPELNPDSRFHFAEIVFGEDYNGYFQQYGSKKRYRPEGAKSLHIVPLRTTGKYPKPWETIVEEGKELQFTPSSGKQTLLELYYSVDGLVNARENGEIVRKNYKDELRMLLDYKFISKALQGLLREPTNMDDDGVVDDGDDYSYDDGICVYMSDDGFCRTHIVQTAETGRWKSSRPNLQNCSNSRDKDYKRIVGNPDLPSIRSIFKAPDGWFLVEADYSGAELMMLAVMAQDTVMIDHCQRSGLKEDDPNYKDIHSGIAVAAFKLSCPPTKKGLEEIRAEHLRTAAKAVIFGLAYGQSADACAVLLRQQGTFISVQEAQELQNTVFTEYREIKPFLNECASRVSIGHLTNMFGRRRRFFFTDDRASRKKMEREAMNSPIQGGVADGVSIAINNIYEERNRRNMRSKICLQIHDSIMLLVPAEELLEVIDPEGGLLKTSMLDRVVLRPTDLDGNVTSNQTYRFNFDMKFMTSWGEISTPDKFIPYGLDPAMAGWKPVEGGYTHKKVKGTFLWSRD
jgi:uracil-DNA glycosylase family 4